MNNIMIIDTNKTETIETSIEYDLDISKLDQDQIDELFTELSEKVSPECVDNCLSNDHF